MQIWTWLNKWTTVFTIWNVQVISRKIKIFKIQTVTLELDGYTEMDITGVRLLQHRMYRYLQEK